MKNECILVISDLHLPYVHKDAFDFLRAVKKEYSPDRVVCIGDEIDCFPQESEILTEIGFKSFREVIDFTHGKLRVAQYCEDGSIEFVYPEAYIDRPNREKLLRIEHSSYLSLTTPRHAIVKRHPTKGTLHRREAWDIEGSLSWHIPRFGMFAPSINNDIEDAEIRLQVAFQADGTFDNGAVKFEFAKERKISRLRNILVDLEIEHTIRLTNRNTTVLYIKKNDVPDYISKVFNSGWITCLTREQKELFINELSFWDGTLTSVGIRYTSVNQDNLNLVQSMAASTGYYVSKCTDTSVTIHLERYENTSQKSATFTEVDYLGNVCCVQVPTGMIIVRQEGHVTVSGNCHALSFHDSDADLPSAGDELQYAIEQLKELYKMFPSVDVLDSNHGSMAIRRFKTHGIPLKFLKDVNEVLEAPSGWKWHKDLKIKASNGQYIYFHHGLEKNILRASQRLGMCVAQGHYHTEFNIQYSSSPAQLLWAMQVGCLIDDDSMSFAYNRTNLGRPILGCGVIVQGQPVLIPMLLEKDKKGNSNWIGEII